MRSLRRRSRIASLLTVGAVSTALVLSGCTVDEDSDQSSEDTTSATTTASQQSSPSESSTSESSEPSDSQDNGAHRGMDHSMDGGDAPAGITINAHPTHPVGSTVTLTADHMKGMKGAKATIAGAFSTYTYEVDYTPTDGGRPVKNHKWVVQQEIKDAGTQRIPDGTDVTIEADHMKGMKGAKGKIVSSTDQTVYMVNYEADGMKVTNHKWVVEDEIKPAND
ncbi:MULTISPECIES: YdhK family protein [Corynebacterium]|uniref:YdhK family protein n=1 Tax=Corynebacterium TaxID=1716 RepID=UPI00195D639D|nr:MULTISPECIES: YdhK family protein [Corynebacterium]MDN8625200.1 YdhK family protein [Corynebacterium kroppenstedtii]QRQ64997.1 YdhK family protein [Corynebacterium kroppenstedtii]